MGRYKCYSCEAEHGEDNMVATCASCVSRLKESVAAANKEVEYQKTQAIETYEKLDADRKFQQDRTHDYCVRMEAAEAEAEYLRETISDLKTPLKNWDTKLAEKNEALSKRNAEIAAFEKREVEYLDVTHRLEEKLAKAETAVVAGVEAIASETLKVAVARAEAAEKRANQKFNEGYDAAEAQFKPLVVEEMRRCVELIKKLEAEEQKRMDWNVVIEDLEKKAATLTWERDTARQLDQDRCKQLAEAWDKIDVLIAAWSTVRSRVLCTIDPVCVEHGAKEALDAVAAMDAALASSARAQEK